MNTKTNLISFLILFIWSSLSAQLFAQSEQKNGSFEST